VGPEVNVMADVRTLIKEPHEKTNEKKKRQFLLSPL